MSYRNNTKLRLDSVTVKLYNGLMIGTRPVKLHLINLLSLYHYNKMHHLMKPEFDWIAVSIIGFRSHKSK